MNTVLGTEVLMENAIVELDNETGGILKNTEMSSSEKVIIEINNSVVPPTELKDSDNMVVAPMGVPYDNVSEEPEIVVEKIITIDEASKILCEGLRIKRIAIQSKDVLGWNYFGAKVAYHIVEKILIIDNDTPISCDLEGIPIALNYNRKYRSKKEHAINLGILKELGFQTVQATWILIWSHDKRNTKLAREYKVGYLTKYIMNWLTSFKNDITLFNVIKSTTVNLLPLNELKSKVVQDYHKKFKLTPKYIKGIDTSIGGLFPNL